MKYLYNFGLDDADIEEIKKNVTDDVFSDLSLFSKIVQNNIIYMRDFGVTNYRQIIVRYPEIFLRDLESFTNIFSKFDKDDLIAKVTKNPAVMKKMVDFVDKNQDFMKKSFFVNKLSKKVVYCQAKILFIWIYFLLSYNLL